MVRHTVVIIGLLSSVMIYAVDARFYNNTKAVLKIKVNIAQGIDQEITLAAGERKVINCGNYLTNWVRDYSITAIVATNDEDGSVQEIQLDKIKHNKLGNVECSVFYTKEVDSKDPHAEKLTFYCVKEEPQKSAEFIRPKRSITVTKSQLTK